MVPEEEVMSLTQAQAATHAEGLSWPWVGVGVIVGAALIATFIYLVDPLLERPVLSAMVASLSLMLVGILVAYHSPGETIRETGVAGIALVALVSIFLTVVVRQHVNWFFYVLAAFYGPSFAMMGGWVGELLQGTLGHEDEEGRGIQWVWITAGVILGFMLSIYSVFVANALFGVNPLGILACFGGSFMVMGYIVGLHSPGITIREPGLAAMGVVILDAVVALMGFRTLFPVGAVVLALAVGMILALAGGWLGEVAQVAKRARKRVSETA